VGSKTIEETGHELQARKISHIYHNDCLWRLAFRDPLGANGLQRACKQEVSLSETVKKRAGNTGKSI
jgi:hypothetical protein